MGERSGLPSQADMDHRFRGTCRGLHSALSPAYPVSMEFTIITISPQELCERRNKLRGLFALPPVLGYPSLPSIVR